MRARQTYKPEPYLHSWKHIEGARNEYIPVKLLRANAVWRFDSATTCWISPNKKFLLPRMSSTYKFGWKYEFLFLQLDQKSFVNPIYAVMFSCSIAHTLREQLVITWRQIWSWVSLDFHDDKRQGPSLALITTFYISTTINQYNVIVIQ